MKSMWVSMITFLVKQVDREITANNILMCLEKGGMIYSKMGIYYTAEYTCTYSAGCVWLSQGG